MSVQVGITATCRQTGAVKPFGPHHCITYFGLVHAFQTNSRGASKTLVTTIRSISLTVFSVISDPLFHLIYNYIQFVETLFPESAIADRPVADCLNRLLGLSVHTLSRPRFVLITIRARTR